MTLTYEYSIKWKSLQGCSSYCTHTQYLPDLFIVHFILSTMLRRFGWKYQWTYTAHRRRIEPKTHENASSSRSHVCKWHASNAVLGPGCVESDKKIQKCLLPEPCKCIDIHVFLWNSKASKRMQWNWNVAHFLVPHFTFILHLSLYLLVPIPSWVVRFDGFEFNFSIYFKHWTANDAVCIQVRRSTERLHIWCKIDAECSRPSESFLFLFFSENGVFRRYICLWSAMQRERTLNQIDCVVRNEFFLPLSLSLDAVHGTRLLCRRKHADESYSGAYRACDA